MTITDAQTITIPLAAWDRFKERQDQMQVAISDIAKAINALTAEWKESGGMIFVGFGDVEMMDSLYGKDGQGRAMAANGEENI